MDTNPNSNRYRVAILLCGMARLYQRGYQNIKQHLIDNPKHQNIEFDFYLTTWNVNGDYSYKTKNFHAPLDKNWVRDDPLPEQTPQELTALYQPQIPIQILDYQEWKTNSQPIFQEFLHTHHLEKEPIRTYNGIFSQYYQVLKAFESFENHKTHYDLVIRTRYDLEFEDTVNFDLNDFLKTKNQNPYPDNLIMEVEQWDRNGIRGNFVVGSQTAIKKYAQLYRDLPTLTKEQVRNTKLANITFPKFVFNYILADGTYPDELTDEEIFDKVKPHFYQKINSFLQDPNRLYYNYSLIPEIFLKYYLESVQHLEVKILKTVQLKAINGQKSHPI